MGIDLDKTLWNSIQDSDAHAFEILFKKYYAPLCRFAVNYTHDLDTAREVVQNLFVYLWENRKTVGIEQSVKSYLTSAVKRNSIRLMQQQHRKLSIDTLPEDSFIDEALVDSLELEELYKQLLEAIEQLPPQCKKIFRMSRFEEKKYAEIALELNLSIKTVEAQMGKALKILRESFHVL